MASLEIIVAVDCDGGFGKEGNIPWKCKEDLAHFASITKEIGVCVMGKHTYLDLRAMRGSAKGTVKKIKKKGILADRETFVVSSTLKQEDVIGATVVPDIRAVLNKYFLTNQRIAVCGGEKLYIEALSSATTIHMTVMDKSYKCDRFFPVNNLANTFTINKEQSKMIETDVDGKMETVRFVRYEKSARM